MIELRHRGVAVNAVDETMDTLEVVFNPLGVHYDSVAVAITHAAGGSPDVEDLRLTYDNGVWTGTFVRRIDAPSPGDGELIVGDPSAILSFGTSMDDNFNYYGCDTFTTSSPSTDSTYSPSPECPNWEYYASYRITVDPAIFGPSGYGGVFMTSVHASPSKTDIETVPVTEGPPLEPDSPDNPWRYFDPYINPDPTTPDTSDTIPITDGPPRLS